MTTRLLFYLSPNTTHPMNHEELQHIPEELRELFALLDEQGLRPELYDTPVPFYDGRVPCGTPNELGDAVPDGYMMLPHGLPGVESVFGLSVIGDSMVGAGIEDGDRLDVLSTNVVRDGNIVVAMIDGKCMVKSFITDEKEFEEWLLDGNGAYVQHFLLYHESDEEKEANREILEDAREKFMSGEWTLADCINRANDDLSNVAPYYLIRNVHKDVLVDAAVELREGDASEIVEMDGALYVIVRMEETPIKGANGVTETTLSLQLTNLLSTYQWEIVGDVV